MIAKGRSRPWQRTLLEVDGILIVLQSICHSQSADGDQQIRDKHTTEHSMSSCSNGKSVPVVIEAMSTSSGHCDDVPTCRLHMLLSFRRAQRFLIVLAPTFPALWMQSRRHRIRIYPPLKSEPSMFLYAFDVNMPHSYL